MTTSPRITRPYLERLEPSLGERDQQVLRSLADLRLACSRQLERLHFADGSPLANARTARRTLGKLTERGLVARLDRRVGGVRAGSVGYIYTLGTGGQQLLGVGAAGGRTRRRPWTPSRTFVAHRLDITELFVRLVEAERSGSFELLDFQSEPSAWRPYTGAHGTNVTLKPDAFVRIGSEIYEDSWFVEVDRATESPLVLSRKAQAYRDYRASGREEARTGVFPRVLFVVPTDKRQSVVERVIDRQATNARELFQVCCFTDAVDVMTGTSA